MRSRGLWIRTLDEPKGYAELMRASYEEAYSLAKERFPIVSLDLIVHGICWL